MHPLYYLHHHQGAETVRGSHTPKALCSQARQPLSNHGESPRRNRFMGLLSSCVAGDIMTTLIGGPSPPSVSLLLLFSLNRCGYQPSTPSTRAKWGPRLAPKSLQEADCPSLPCKCTDRASAVWVGFRFGLFGAPSGGQSDNDGNKALGWWRPNDVAFLAMRVGDTTLMSRPIARPHPLGSSFAGPPLTSVVAPWSTAVPIHVFAVWVPNFSNQWFCLREPVSCLRRPWGPCPQQGSPFKFGAISLT